MASLMIFSTIPDSNADIAIFISSINVFTHLVYSKYLAILITRCDVRFINSSI